jgi:hypothetical protein
VHGIDVAGVAVIRKRVSRAKVLKYFGELPPCLVGIEACPSAHRWAARFKRLVTLLDGQTDAAELFEGPHIWPGAGAEPTSSSRSS